MFLGGILLTRWTQVPKIKILVFRGRLLNLELSERGSELTEVR